MSLPAKVLKARGNTKPDFRNMIFKTCCFSERYDLNKYFPKAFHLESFSAAETAPKNGACFQFAGTVRCTCGSLALQFYIPSDSFNLGSNAKTVLIRLEDYIDKPNVGDFCAFSGIIDPFRGPTV
jgi:hypothetical protein